MVKTLIPEDSYIYKDLKEEFPGFEPFYSRYDSGDYYNTAYIEYYDKYGSIIKRTDLGYYGWF